MSNTFNATRLAGNRMLVTGTDEGERAILDTTEWDEYKHSIAHKEAEASFDAAVKAFYAPIEEATEAARKALEEAHAVFTDPAFNIVLEQGSEGVAPKHEVRLVLSKDAAVLRMIESGDTSRLVWVGSDIEITAYVPAAPVDLAEVLGENA